jgi:hypothetical protein
MPDPSLSDALKEAYATAPARSVVYHTIELYHPEFSTPIRVVRDTVALDARLEATAPRNAGEVVTFVAFAFDLVKPELTATGTPQCTLVMDNIGRDVADQLDQAIVAGQPITLIYREFLSDTLNDGPETDPPPVLTLTSVRVTTMRITAQAGFPPDLVNRRYPRLDYSAEVFPGLAS